LTRQPAQTRYTCLSDISRSIEVSMEFKTAFAATEIGALTVPLVDMSAVRALLRSVSSIYQENVLSKSLRFVADKLLKLIERPAIELYVKHLASTSALLNSNLAKIFKSKYSVLRVHYLLGYAVIHVSREPSFPTRHELKLAFGWFGAFGLQLLSEIGILSTPILDLLGVEKSVIRADSNIHYSTVYSKNFKVINFLRIIMLQRYVQIEAIVFAVTRDSTGLDNPGKIISIMRWYKEGRLDPPFDTGNGSYSTNKVDSDNSLIVSHGREGLTLWKSSKLNSFESIAGTVSRSLNQRGWKFWNVLTNMLVGCIVVINFVPRSVLESPFCGYGERFGVSSHRIKE
jgi:hypothetical protein